MLTSTHICYCRCFTYRWWRSGCNIWCNCHVCWRLFSCFNCNVAYALSIAPVIYLLHPYLQSILEGNNAGPSARVALSEYPSGYAPSDCVYVLIDDNVERIDNRVTKFGAHALEVPLLWHIGSTKSKAKVTWLEIGGARVALSECPSGSALFLKYVLSSFIHRRPLSLLTCTTLTYQVRQKVNS